MRSQWSGTTSSSPWSAARSSGCAFLAPRAARSSAALVTPSSSRQTSCSRFRPFSSHRRRRPRRPGRSGRRSISTERRRASSSSRPPRSVPIGSASRSVVSTRASCGLSTRRLRWFSGSSTPLHVGRSRSPPARTRAAAETARSGRRSTRLAAAMPASPMDRRPRCERIQGRLPHTMRPSCGRRRSKARDRFQGRARRDRVCQPAPGVAQQRSAGSDLR